MQHSDLIRVRKSPGKGRGVFAIKPIPKGAVVERVPVVLVPINDLVDGLKNPTLNKYFYVWTKTHVAICLGYGLLYNHSYEPNAVYEHGAHTMTFRARRDVAADEEITINYNCDPQEQTLLSFDVR
jgi:SET domain-containing protein